MAELRGGGACSLPQCSLVSVPVPLIPSRCNNQLVLDLEQPGIRLQRRYNAQPEKRIRTRIPASLTGTDATTSQSDEESGTRKFPGTFKLRTKGDNVVFVAGATGKVGSRTVKELLKLGFCVRAGVRDIEKAKSVLEESIISANEVSSPLLKVLSFLGFKQPEKLEFVGCDLENQEEIESALGNAGVVVCAVGASEKEVLDVTGPYRIDYKATKNLILAAKNSNVKHFLLVTSLGTTKFGWPAAALNLFWGVLVWKAKAEKALIDSGLVYTIVRPGGMEKPTDAFKETHNLRLAPKDAFSGGQVSRLQVAELLACITSNLDLAENKILEVIAETTAPRRPIIELLEEIPSDTKEVKDKENEEKEKGTLKLKNKKTQAESPVKVVEKEQKNQQAAKKTEDDRRAKELLRQKAAEKEEEEAKQREKAEEDAKKKAAEAERTRELREKFAKELAALKKQEELAVAEAEKLQKKRAELSEKAQAASNAAAKAEALANALLGAAKKGKLLTEDDKKKIASTAAKPPSNQEPEKKLKESIPKLKAETKQGKAKAAPVEEKRPTKARVPAPAPQVPEKAFIRTKSDQQAAAGKKTDEKAEKPPPPASEPVDALVAEKKTKEDIKEDKQKAEKPKVEKKQENAEQVKPVEAAASTKKEIKAEVKEEKQNNVPKESKAVPAPAPAPAPAPTAAQKKIKGGAEERKPFRWFWGPPEPEPVEDAIKESSPGELKPASPPLSPYNRYPDLKPPTSPKPPVSEASPLSPDPKPPASPQPPSAVKPQQEEVVSTRASPVSEPDSKTSSEVVTPPKEPPKTQKAEVQNYQKTVKEREQAALEKARSLLWAWPETPSAEEPKIIKDDKTPRVKVEKEVKSPTISRPLSPYWRYPDLKPPTTPSPRPPKLGFTEASPPKGSSNLPPESAKDREAAALAKAKASIAWPWTKDETDGAAVSQDPELEDKKPSLNFSEAPIQSSSPSLTPESKAVASTQTSEAPQQTVASPDEEKATPEPPKEEEKAEPKDREVEALSKAKAASAFVWPWTESKPKKTSLDDGQASTPVPKASAPADSESTSKKAVSVSRPLSPYARYDDLKPPSSPTPSPPTITSSTSREPEVPKSKEPPKQASSDSTPGVDEAALEAQARAEAALKKARASIKWTWN